MSSGARVVLAIFGGVAAITLLAVAAFLLTDEESVRCVEGELQDNAVDEQGRFLPRTETFASIDEAEMFVCRRLPHPRDTGDLALEGVEVTRTTNLGGLIEGDGSATASFLYTAEEGERSLLRVSVSFPAQGVSRADERPETVMIADEEAFLVPADGGAAVYWSTEDFDFEARAAFNDTFTREELLPVLESIR